MTQLIRADEAFMAAAAILFFFVLVRFAAALRRGRHGRGALAGSGALFAIAPPTLALAVQPAFNFAPGDYNTLVFGSMLWITLALAFSAFAIARLRSPNDASP